MERRNRILLGGVLGSAGVLAATLGAARVFVDEEPPGIVQTTPPTPTGTASPSPDLPTAGVGYEGYTMVTDDTGTLAVEIPMDWSDRLSNGWFTEIPPFDGRVGPGLNAAPDVRAWFEDLSTPGMFVGVSARVARRYDPASLAEAIRYSGCTFDVSAAYTAGDLTGESATWMCPGSPARWFHLAAWPEDRRYIVLVQVKLVDSRDDQALDRILGTLEVRDLP